MRWFSTAVFALLACRGAAAGALQLRLSPYAKTDLRTVEVTVNGHKSPFIFDTGAGTTVFTPEEIRYAACAPSGEVTGRRADGGKVTSTRCGPVTFDVGDYRVDGEVDEFDLSKLMDKGMPPVGGILGLHAFEGHALTLDFLHDRVTIETQRTLAHRIRAMRPIRLRLVRDKSGDIDPFIGVLAGATTLWLELDSGNDGPVFLAPRAQRLLGIALPEHGNRPLDLDVIGLGRVPVAAASRKLIYDGQLDPAFLHHIVLTIDLRQGRAWARLNDGGRR